MIHMNQFHLCLITENSLHKIPHLLGLIIKNSRLKVLNPPPDLFLNFQIIHHSNTMRGGSNVLRLEWKESIQKDRDRQMSLENAKNMIKELNPLRLGKERVAILKTI